MSIIYRFSFVMFVVDFACPTALSIFSFVYKLYLLDTTRIHCIYIVVGRHSLHRYIYTFCPADIPQIGRAHV